MAISDSSVGLMFKLNADTKAAKADVTAFKDFVLKEAKAIETASTESLGKVGAGLSSLGGPAGIAALGIGAIATAAIAVSKAMFDLAKDAAKFSDGLVDLNAKTNVSIETLSVLKHNAELAGTSIESIGASLVIFEKNLAKASNGSEDMAARLKALGVNLKQDTETNLLAVFKRLGEMEDGYKKTELAMSVFGRQGASMLALLKQMDNDFSKAADEAKRLGLVIGTDDAKAADDFDDALKTLNSAVKGLQAQLGSGLIPAMTTLVKELTDGIAAANELTRAVGGLKAIASTGIDIAVRFVMSGGNALSALGQFIGEKAVAPFFQDPFVSGGIDFNKGGGTPAPSFPKGGKGSGRSGPKDITQAQLAVKQLKAEQEEAQRAYNGTREAAQRLLDVTMRLIEAETREANERLPNKAAARMAEVRQQQLKALEEYAKQLKEVSDAELKHMADLSETINKQNEDNRKAIEAANELDKQLREEEADSYLRRALLQQQFHATFYADRQKAIRNIAALEIDAEQRKFEREREALEKERDAQERDEESIKTFNDRIVAAEAEKEARIALIRRQAQIDQERDQPNSNRNLLGAGIADALQDLALTNEIIGQQTTLWQQVGTALRAYTQQLTDELPNAMQLAVISIQAVAQATTDSISAFIAGKATLRQAIGGIVDAMLAPYKKWAQTKAMIHFAAAAGDFAFGNFAGGAKHLLAGAAFAALAGVIGAAGSLIAGSGASPSAAAAPSSATATQQNQTRIIEQGDRQRPQPQVIIIRAETEPGVIVRRVVEDYRNNGATRQTLRRDMLGDTG